MDSRRAKPKRRKEVTKTTTKSPSLTQAARDGALEAWLEILSQRHPDLIWVPKRRLDPAAKRT